MEGVAQIVIGLIFIALFIQLVKRGPGGAMDWFRAKFLGQPAAPLARPRPFGQPPVGVKP